MLHVHLIHTVDIEKPDHGIVGRKKTPNWLTATGSNIDVECKIEGTGDVGQITLLGRAVTQSFRGTFQPTTDIDVGDKVIWKDRTPPKDLIVEGRVDIVHHADPTQAKHIEVAMKLRDPST